MLEVTIAEGPVAPVLQLKFGAPVAFKVVLSYLQITVLLLVAVTVGFGLTVICTVFG